MAKNEFGLSALYVDGAYKSKHLTIRQRLDLFAIGRRGKLPVERAQVYLGDTSKQPSDHVNEIVQRGRALLAVSDLAIVSTGDAQPISRQAFIEVLAYQMDTDSFGTQARVWLLNLGPGLGRLRQHGVIYENEHIPDGHFLQVENRWQLAQRLGQIANRNQFD